MPGQEEDISPYATFHLLGMREEAKAAAAGNNLSLCLKKKSRKLISNQMKLSAAAGMGAAQNFQTMPSTPGSGPLTGPNTPAHQRNPQAAQTMFNVRQASWESFRREITYFSLPAPTQHS